MSVTSLFSQELKSINIGLVSFKEALDDAEFAAIQVEWRPPAGGDAKVLEALKRIKRLRKS
ncbi:MAG TPA: fdrA domain protein [bacterium]|nr:fdrA domain protein [bacterium]HPJ72254.1 fdrA domain protein [bacterium]HPQ67047.1 fdrA domain protein [bacterium]